MKFKRTGVVTTLVLLALIVYAALSLLRMKSRVADAEVQRSALAAQAQALAADNAALDYEIAHSTDPDMIEKVAREKLGLVLPGEIVYYDMSD